MAMFRDVRMSHAAGLCGTPSLRHCVTAASNASWVDSSATARLPVSRMTAARIRPQSER